MLDLQTFTATRPTGGTAGGTVSVLAGATLRIGGTNSEPTNFKTYTYNAASTVEYYGDNQSVSNATYGNLIFSSSTVSVKTMPAAAITVAGNFTSQVGVGTGVSFVAGAAITVTGSVSIGAGTTFDGGSFAHSVTGNWTNNGTFTGNASTVSLKGASATITGTGTNNFVNLTIATGANVTVATNTSLTLSGTLTTTTTGTFTHTAGGTGTVTMSGTAKAITGTGMVFNNLNLPGTITTANGWTVAGNLTVSGSLTASAGTIILSGTGATFTGGGVTSFKNLTVSGTVTATNSFTIAGAALNISGALTATAGTATFTGTSTNSGTANLFNVTINGTKLLMSANSTLGIAGTETLTAGTLDTATATPNTVNYNSTGAQTVLAGAYYHLTVSNGGTKTAGGAVTNNGDFTIGTGTTYNASSFTNQLSGNWINNGSYSAGTGTVQLLGSADVAITGATTFNILTENKATANNVVTLNNNVSVGTLNMTLGQMQTGPNTLTITSTRTGGGTILGTITRAHAFSTATAYAFEGTNSTVTFTTISGSVSSVTMAVGVGTVADFPFGGAINRQYTNSLTASGAYVATLRLHYNDSELNGNVETNMQFWRNSSSWAQSGKTSTNSTDNWIEQTNLTDLTGRWTMSDDANVVQWNGSVSSAWENATNWTAIQGVPSRPPTSAEAVQIGTSNFVNQPTINSAASVKSIQFGSAQAATLTVNSGSLTTAGNISGVWTNTVTHAINIGATTLTVGGNLALSDGTTGDAINLNASSGTVTVTGSVTESGGANLAFTGAGALNVAGDFVYGSGTFTPGSSTVTYNGSGSQIVAGGITYNNLSLNKASGAATLGSTATVNGNLNMATGGSLLLNGALTVASNVVVGTGTTLNCGSVTLSVGGNWTNSGTFTAGTSTAVLNGTGAQSVPGVTFNNLTINKTSGTATLAGNATMNGDLNISAGTLDLGSFTANRGAAGGTLTLGANTTLNVAASFPANYSTHSLAANSLVFYNGAAAQTVSAEAYGNLSLANGGASAKTLAGTASIAGDFLINSGATFDASTFALTAQGNWTNNGTFTPTTSSVTLAGSSKTVGGINTFNNLSVTGSYTATTNITVNGTMNNSGTWSAGAATNTFAGDFSNSGTLTSSGTVIFSGTAAQNLTFSSGFTSTGAVNFNGTTAPVLQNVNVNNTGGLAPNTGWTIGGTFVVASGVTFTGGVNSYAFNGSFTNNGTFTSAGTVTFNPAAAVTCALQGTAFTSTGLVIFGGSGAITLSGGGPTFALVTITNNNAAGITPSANWTTTDDLTIAAGAIFNAGTGLTHTVGGDWVNNGTFNAGTSTISFNSATAIGGSATTTFNHLTIASGGAVTNTVNFNISGNFTNNGTFNTFNIAITFNGSSSSVITGSTTPTSFDDVLVAKSAAIVTLGLNLSNTGDLHISGGTVDCTNFTITTTGTCALIVDAGATLKIGGGNTLPTYTTYSFDPAGTVEYSGSSSQAIAAQSYGNLTSSSTGARVLPSSGTVGVAGTFTPGANSYTITGSTVNFNGAGSQTIPAFNYNNLTSSSSGARTLASSGTIGVASVFTPGANSYTVTGSTVSFNGTTQSIPIFTYNNLTANDSGTATLAGNVTVGGALSIASGTLADGGFVAAVNGNVSNAATYSGAGKISLTGGSASHTLSGSGTYNNLELNDANGAALSLTNLTVNGTLTLTTGTITTTTNKVIIPTAGSVSRTNGYVIGNLQKAVASGAGVARTFEVGTTNGYNPVSVTFSNVTVAGNLTAAATFGDHPSIGSATINPTNSANVYWTLSQDAPLAFNSFNAVFNFNNPGDLDAGGNPAVFKVGNFVSSAWNYPVLGNRTTTNTAAVAMASLGDFQLGQNIITTLTVTVNNTNRIYGAANPAFSGSFSGLQSGDNITATYTTTATTNSTVGGYNITPVFSDPGNKLGNYAVTTNLGTLTITPAALTVTINSTNRGYGATNPGFSGTITGLLNNDNITATYTTTATTNSAVGGYSITPVWSDPGSKLGNYAVTTNLGTLTITKVILTGTTDNKSRAYGQTNPVFTVTYSGFVNGENSTIVTGTLSSSTAATTNSPVGNYAVTVFGQTAPNYTMNYVAGTLTVTSSALTVTANGASRGYGATNPAFSGTITGLVNNDNITATYTTTATTNSATGSYNISPVFSDPGSKLGNYTVTTNLGTLTITNAPLTVTVNNTIRGYGATNPVFTGTITGLQNNDNITATYATTAATNSAAGGYGITVALNDPGSKLGNYTVTTNLGTLTITNVALTVTVNNSSRGYGATNPVFTGTITGLQNNDNITATYATAATTNSAVGGYNITPGLSDPGSKLANYTVTTNLGTLTITNAILTGTADNKSRAYGATNPVFTATYTGFVNGETSAIITGTLNGSSTATTNSSVGNYPVTVSGQSAPNYTINYVSGNLTITNVALTVTVNNSSRGYGAANPTFSGTITGLQNNDSITATYTTTATTNSAVGGYSIAPVLSDPGSKLGNYTVITNLGTLTITNAILTGTADNKSRSYGATNPVFTATYTGFVNGETSAIVTGTLTGSTTAATNSVLGTYPITVSGQSAPNYTINYVAGTLTVTGATLTVTVNNSSRGYGATNPIFSGTIIGLQNNDNITAAYTTAATTNSAVGSYSITPVLSDPGSQLSNYIVTTNLGTLTITNVSLTVTVNSASRGYGATNPVFTGTITGLQNNDTITATYTTTATTNSAVGTYNIAPVLSDPGSKLGNYTVTTNLGALTITNVSLTVTVNSASRGYGATNPVFSGTITGLQNNDNITAAYTTTATTNSPNGNYNITPVFNDPGSKLGDYTVTTNLGTLTITNVAPFLTLPTNQIMDELTTLSVNAVATDLDPSQTFTFVLLAAPTGMTIDPSSGLISWTPDETQGPSTNTVTVAVTDSGTPALSVTNSFTIVVREVNWAPAPINLQLLKSFGTTGTDGQTAEGTPMVGADGLLYATTFEGGIYGGGTIFKINTNGTGYTIIYNFGATGSDGLSPYCALVQGGDGTLYGTTYFGGSANKGTVFKIKPDGTGYTKLHDFGLGSDGANAYAELYIGQDGALYGTTLYGGPFASGVVFKLNTDGSGYTRLHDFGSVANDGSLTYAGLVQGPAGFFYGVTDSGGTNGVGTVFKLNATGSSYQILYSFSTTGGDGQFADVTLTLGNDGVLYSTTYGGGVNGDANSGGTVFKINRDGTGYAKLHDFGGPGEGQLINAGLVKGDNGVLYGGAYVAGAYGDLVSGGTLFKINTDGTGYRLLYSFHTTGNDPQLLNATFVRDSSGAFYGTSEIGGSAGDGALFRFVDLDDQVLNSVSTLSVTAPASDADIPTNTLTYALISGPGGLSMNSSSGLITWTPTHAQDGTTNTVLWQVTDNGSPALGATNNFNVIIQLVNQAPGFNLGGAALTNLEDAGAQTVLNWATNISSGPASESWQTVSFLVTNNNTNLFSTQPAISPTGTLTYTSATNANGTATVTVYAQDNGGTNYGGTNTSASQTFTITVTPVNDPPTLDAISNVSINEDAGLQTISLTGITAGPTNEVQNLTITASSSNPALIPTPGVSYISPNTTGALTFTPTIYTIGSSVITVVVSDNGGTANGGVNAVTNTFTVTVNAVNHVPSFTGGGNVFSAVTNVAQTFPNWATNISPGLPANESGQMVNFLVSINYVVDNDFTPHASSYLFSTLPAIDAGGNLTFTPTGNAGLANISVRIHDDGGTSNGGVDTSAAQTFNLGVGSTGFTPATGGEAISVDDFATGHWTFLSGPTYYEGSSGIISAGTIVLIPPPGFEFDTNTIYNGTNSPAQVVITDTVSPTVNSTNINGATNGQAFPLSMTSTSATFTITSASINGALDSIVAQNFRIRPTTTNLVSGYIYFTGTSSTNLIASGPTGTDFGDLSTVPGAPYQLAFQTQPSATATAGIAFDQQPVVLVQDQFGNTVTNANTNFVTLSRFPFAANSALQGDTNATAVAGVVDFTGQGLFFSTNGTCQLSADSAGLVSALSSNITTYAAAGVALVIQTQPSATAAAGVAFAQQPVIAVVDSFGNVTTTNTTTVVTVSRNTASGTTNLQGTTNITVVNGIATFTDLNYQLPETIQIDFTATSLTTTTSTSIAVSPGAASRLVFMQQPALETNGAVFTTQPVVKTLDAFGNLTTNVASSVPVTISLASGSGTLSGTTTLDIGSTAGSGVVSFTGLKITNTNVTDATESLAVSASGLTGATSTVFTIVATNRAPVFAGWSALDVERIRSFGAPALQGNLPFANLIVGSDGRLYGAAQLGGINGDGTLFSFQPDGTGFQVLHSFVESDGENPYGAVCEGNDGVLYGTTYNGGANDSGTIFKMNKDGSGFAVLYSFGDGSDGGNPQAALIQGADGVLYGTTSLGGISDMGTLFKINTDGSHYAVLHTFNATHGEGRYPKAALFQAADGLLYGTTERGGNNNLGAVFKMSPSGSGYTVLHHFTGASGKFPDAPLIQGTNGLLYGTTYFGGSSDVGAVFSLTTNGVESVVYNFVPVSGENNPAAGLVFGQDGALYGTTYYGGDNAHGLVFRVTTNGSFSQLYSFTGTSGDGQNPNASLARAADGTLFGTTLYGGSSGLGTIFTIDPSLSYHALLSLQSSDSTQSQSPDGALVEGPDGTLYGSTFYGGSENAGVLYKMSKDGAAYTVLHDFKPSTGDGRNPYYALKFGLDGLLYGTTDRGGTNDSGLLFKISTNGSSYVKLHDFGASGDGVTLYSTPIQSASGKLFGVTDSGGVNGSGTLYAINPDGTGYIILHSFGGAGDGANSDGRLLLAGDGLIYGTTLFGGANSEGTVFTIATNGSSYQVLYSFGNGPTDGQQPFAGLIEGLDGSLYGAGTFGGTDGAGTLFKINKDGSSYTTLHNFSLSSGDGAQPYADLTFGTDGLIYGTTYYGGAFGFGTIFRSSANGVYSLLYSFGAGANDGEFPFVQLTQASDGNYYGVTESGGDLGLGTAFRLRSFTNDLTINELSTLSMTINATDADGPGANLTFALLSAPVGMSIDPTSGIITWTPSEAQGPSTNIFNVVVTDNDFTPSLSVTNSYTNIVNEVNAAPRLIVPANQTVSEAVTMTVTNLAIDSDLPTNTLTFALISGPSGLTLDSASGVITWTPSLSQAPSTNTVVVSLTDYNAAALTNNILSVTNSFTITVGLVNHAPSFTKGSNVAVDQKSGSYSQTGWATAISPGPANESSQTVSFIVTNNNAGLFTIQPAVASNGTLAFTPNATQTGTATVTVYAQDNGGTANGGTNASAAQTFTIVVGQASLSVAAGGTAISADTAGVTWTPLSGPVYQEGGSGNVGAGAITLNAPTGFAFDTTSPVPTVIMHRTAGSGASSLNINGAADGTALTLSSVSSSQLQLTITQPSASGVVCSLTWQNVRVRPTVGTPLASGNITSSGTAAIYKITNGVSNFGSLKEISGIAAQVGISTQPSGTATAAVPFAQQPVVTIQDQFGNVLNTANGRADNSSSVTAGIQTGSSSLQGTTTVSVSNGVATFSNLSYNIAQTITLSFHSASLTPAVSSAINIMAGSAYQIGFAQQPVNTTAGATNPISVQVRDLYGNSVTSAGVSITLSLQSGAGPLGGTLTQLTDASGLATFTNVTLKVVGTKQLLATNSSLGSVLSSSFVVSAAPAVRLVFVQQPGTETAGVLFQSHPSVQTLDAYGNVSTSGLPSSINVSLFVVGTGVLSGTTNVDIGTGAGKGLATFTNLTINLGGAKQLGASASGLTGAASSSFTVNTSLSILQPHTDYSVGRGPTGMYLGNLRGKSTWRDMAVANYLDGTITVRLCNDDGTFASAATYAVGPNPMGVWSGNFYHTTCEDIVVANSGTNTITLLLNLGHGTFWNPRSFRVGSTPNPGPVALIGAYLRSSTPDLVVANQNENTVSVLLNTGGVFGAPVNYPVGSGPSSIVVADLNGDGIPDILTANKNDNTLSILPGRGNGVFGTAITITLPGNPQPVYALVGDFNNDKRPDIAVANYNSNSISILLCQTNHTFVLSTNYPVGMQPSSLLVRDMDQDGYVDMVTANSGDNTLSYLRNLRNGSFTNLGSFSVGSKPVTVVGSNFNNDQATDLAVTCYNDNIVSVLLNAVPLAYAVAVTVPENVPARVTLVGTLQGSGTLSYAVVDQPAHGTLSGTPPVLTYTPNLNYLGNDVFHFSTSNGSAVSAPGTVTLTVLGINQAPTFSLAATNITVIQDSVATNITFFVTNIVAGPINEATQTVTFVVTTTNKTQFTNQPVIGKTGTLAFKVANAAIGVATINVYAQDNGGTLFGGTNRSPIQTFTVTITPNPMRSRSGTYNGLFYNETNIGEASSGYFSATVTGPGTYSGKVLCDGRSNVIAGKFDVTGYFQTNLVRTGKPTITMAMTCDGNDQITGTLATTNWSASLIADRLVFNATTNPAPKAGHYTFVLPVTGAAATNGVGYGLATIATSGTVTASGTLSDGTAYSQSTTISKNGEWPFYLPLYSGAGSLISWVNFTNRPASSLEGAAVWMRTNRFTNAIILTGSSYVKPLTGFRALDVTNGNAIFGVGALITNTITLKTNNTITVTGGTNRLALAINTTNGAITGTFLNPTTHVSTAIKAVLLQQTREAAGFTGGTNTTNFKIEPQ